MASTSYDAFQHHLATAPPLNFSADVSHFLAASGASSFADFSEPGYNILQCCFSCGESANYVLFLQLFLDI